VSPVPPCIRPCRLLPAPLIPSLLAPLSRRALPLLDDSLQLRAYLCLTKPPPMDIVHDAYLRAMRGFAGSTAARSSLAVRANPQLLIHLGQGAAAHPPAEMADEEMADLPDSRRDPESALIRSEE